MAASPVILRTPRLLLREFRIDDAAALAQIEGDPSVTRYLPFGPRSLDETRERVAASIHDQAEEPRRNYDLAIILSDGGSKAAADGPGPLIGRCGLGVSRPEHREAIIWYVLHPAHWGRGYAVEAASAVLNLAFGPLGLHRVWADCDPRNTGSCRVAERLGMTLEGRLRENYFLKGEWCSTAVYAILETEWPRPEPPRSRGG